MASHFSTIGFDVRTHEDMIRHAEHAFETARRVETEAGAYLHWSGASGAELWLQIDETNDLIGLNPHFCGPSRLRLAITSRVLRKSATVLDGAFHAWAEPEPGEHNRAYPLVFDCPNAATYSVLRCPGVATAQIAAFAHDIDLFPSLDAFEAKQAGADVKYAAQSFMPAGLFDRNESDEDGPKATAVLTGLVKEVAIRKNEITGSKFYWARVESYAGDYDVVIDPELAPHAPEVGGVVTGLFWLSGCLVEYERRLQSVAALERR